MRVYIAGKITGREKEDYLKQFCDTALMLRGRGHEVVNPAYHDNDLNYWGYMRVGLLLLEMCDAIYMLPGWEDSDGAKLERLYAKHLGKEIIHQ